MVVLLFNLVSFTCYPFLINYPSFLHHIIQNIPSHLSSRKEFSNASRPGAPGSTGKPPESNGSQSKILIGGAAVSAALLAAYQLGFLDKYLEKEKLSVPKEAQINATTEDLKSAQHSIDELVSLDSEKFNNENPALEHAEQKVDAHLSQPEIVIEDSGDKLVPLEDKSDIVEDQNAAAKENQLPEYPQSSQTSGDLSKESVVQSDGIIGIKNTESEIARRQEEEIQDTSTSTQGSTFLDENETKDNQSKQQEIEERREVLMSLS